MCGCRLRRARGGEGAAFPLYPHFGYRGGAAAFRPYRGGGPSPFDAGSGARSVLPAAGGRFGARRKRGDAFVHRAFVGGGAAALGARVPFLRALLCGRAHRAAQRADGIPHLRPRPRRGHHGEDHRGERTSRPRQRKTVCDPPRDQAPQRAHPRKIAGIFGGRRAQIFAGRAHHHARRSVRPARQGGIQARRARAHPRPLAERADGVHRARRSARNEQ